MPESFPGSPIVEQGALIKLSQDVVGNDPKTIFFQFNPEELSRQLKPFTAANNGANSNNSGRGRRRGNTPWYEQTLSEPFDPQETFNLKLEFDDRDAPEELTENNGVNERIAALEMLLFPVGDEQQRSGASAPQSRVPIVLFCWGENRVVPVRLTSFSVKEEEYAPDLRPIRATVEIGMQVVTDKDINNMGNQLTETERIAARAYLHTREQKDEAARRYQSSLPDNSYSTLLPFEG